MPYTSGLALGKWLTDKEFIKEAGLVRHRLGMAKKDADLQHPLHIEMIQSTNALIEEIQAIAKGTMKPSERVLSNTKDTVPLVTHLYAASKQAAKDVSGGKQKLLTNGRPFPAPISSIGTAVSGVVIPIDAKAPPGYRDDKEN